MNRFEGGRLLRRRAIEAYTDWSEVDRPYRSLTDEDIQSWRIEMLSSIASTSRAGATLPGRKAILDALDREHEIRRVEAFNALLEKRNLDAS